MEANLFIFVFSQCFVICGGILEPTIKDKNKGIGCNRGLIRPVMRAFKNQFILMYYN